MASLRVRQGGTLFPKDRCVVSDDGTHIAYTIRGRGPVTVVLCAGYVCPDNFWRYLAPALEKRYRVLIWNYRGTGVSGLPREPGYRGRKITVDDFRVERYARDLLAVLDHEGISDGVVLLGHSMGVQVALEAYRVMRKRVRAIVAVTGPYSSPLKTFYNTTLMPIAFPAVRALLNLFPRPMVVLWRALLRSPIPHPAAIRMGALGKACRAEDMAPFYEHLADVDPLLMLKAAQAMHLHSAEDLLREISVPVLVMVGERDNFTPPWLGRSMVARVPDGELVLIPEGTHGAIIEDPKRVNHVILDFLARRVAAPGPRRRAQIREAGRA